MTKQEIKDNYAKEQGFEDWHDLMMSCFSISYKIEEHQNNVMELYAMGCLKKASDRFEQDYHGFKEHYTRITYNENNLIK